MPGGTSINIFIDYHELSYKSWCSIMAGGQHQQIKSGNSYPAGNKHAVQGEITCCQ